MTFTRRQTLGALGTAAALPAMTMGLSACGSSAEGDGTSLKILQYEDPTSAQGQGWKRALEIFKEKHPDVAVDFQQTSFDAVRQNAKITLSGNEVPDVIEFNKGNADGGQLAAQGLLTDLTETVTARGWDAKVSDSMSSFALYEDGMAGSGSWFGIPNIGEYVTLFYNQDLFDQHGISPDISDLEGLEAAMDTLLVAGVTPIASSAATSQGFNQMWIWYSLVSAIATRDEIDDFMFVKGPVDFSASPWAEGTERFQSWIDRGYVGTDIAGLNFEQATVNFLSGNAAMVVWNHGVFHRAVAEADFNWGWMTFPGANLVMGSSGHLWGVPERAKNKELAYEFIDITLSEEVQNLIGELGGLPIAADPAAITDERTRDYTERFVQLMDDNALSYYPDYPVIGFLDFIQEHMQAMSNGNETAQEYLDALQSFYDEGTQQ
ncbi:ABC transporter substrate-binding protein [Brachybacterium paraconglomeratum]|uniref:ABC transporter substrate-binding protein n=1 Tax=Brachybacterium paraconglomeratum TaxID=173362 RepID=UPI00223B55F2|nr:ABC transporter substrate-binding protein [Brachybacterium paraconglomeratum]MCT1437675.1 ABC transporter substrate-binding protein [Brachybacterium paraconglomeratum]